MISLWRWLTVRLLDWKSHSQREREGGAGRENDGGSGVGRVHRERERERERGRESIPASSLAKEPSRTNTGS